MVRKHIKIWTLSGNAYLTERKFWFIWLQSGWRSQKWSKLMTEAQYFRGIRIGHFRIAWSLTYKQWLDGDEPCCEPST